MVDEVVPEAAENAPAPVAPENTQETKVDAPVEKTTSSDWRAALPDDVRENASIAKFTDMGALAKSYVNLEQMLGGDKIAVPKHADDKESWDKVYKAIGRPDTKEGYEFQKPEELPEGFDYPVETESAFREAAYGLGLSQIQAQSLRDWFVASSAQNFTTTLHDKAGEVDQTVADLTKEWGNATQQKINAAKAAVNALVGPEFAQMLDETGMGNNAHLIRGFAKLAEATGGDSGLVGGAMQENTPGDLDAQIADHFATHQEALMNKTHPEHRMRLEQRNMLFHKRHPEQAA